MASPNHYPSTRMQDHAWFAGLLVLYSFVELSFNHRMLELTAGVLSARDLDGLQFWGRLIAGLALACSCFAGWICAWLFAGRPCWSVLLWV